MGGCIYLEWKNHHQCLVATKGTQIPVQVGAVAVAEVTAILARVREKAAKG